MCSKIIPLATVIVSVHLMKGSSKNTYLVCTEAEFNMHEGGGQPYGDENEDLFGYDT